jgi:hypothetical protein
METYEVLQQAIPQKASGRVAQLLNISADLVRKWRREPESEDAPSGTGQRSPLDRICDLLDIVFLVNPGGVPLILNHINSHYRSLMQTHAKPFEDLSGRVDCTSDLLTETIEAVNSLNRDGCTDNTLQQLVEMRDAADQAIKRVESTIAAE